MIQRIQSIFLFLAAASFLCHFLFPFASSDQATATFFADGAYSIQDNMGMLIMAVLGGLLALVAIFMFKKRGIQLRLSYLVIVLSILLPVLAILLFFNAGHTMNSLDKVEDGIGLYLPIASILFTALAIRYIRSDDKLVKSMDRLR